MWYNIGADPSVAPPANMERPFSLVDRKQVARTVAVGAVVTVITWAVGLSGIYLLVRVISKAWHK